MRLCWSSFVALPALLLLAACGVTGPLDRPTSPPPATTDAATRSSPVVADRPARVFVFASLSDSCEALPAPQITVTEQPAKGQISFQPRQATTIASSANSTCTGQQAIGTGVYYTARAGTTGRDRFTVVARMAGGAAMTRVFEVHIAP